METNIISLEGKRRKKGQIIDSFDSLAEEVYISNGTAINHDGGDFVFVSQALSVHLKSPGTKDSSTKHYYATVEIGDSVFEVLNRMIEYIRSDWGDNKFKVVECVGKVYLKKIISSYDIKRIKPLLLLENVKVSDINPLLKKLKLVF